MPAPWRRWPLPYSQKKLKDKKMQNEQTVEPQVLFKRDDLVHAVIWPKGKSACVSLIDAYGVEQSLYPVRAPRKGSELAKMIPQGYSLLVHECLVVNMSGKLVIGTSAPFDTSVVTERAEVTFEERMNRLERIQVRRDARQAQLERENAELLRQIEEGRAAQSVVEPVTEETPPEPPQSATEMQTDQEAQEVNHDA